MSIDSTCASQSGVIWPQTSGPEYGVSRPGLCLADQLEAGIVEYSVELCSCPDEVDWLYPRAGAVHGEQGILPKVCNIPDEEEDYR